MRIFLITAAFVALPVLAACGSDEDAAKPTVTKAELSQSLQDKGLKDTAFAECAAELYVAEGISQEGLRAMISDKYDTETADQSDFGMSEEDADKARQANSKIFTECRATQ